MSSVDLNIIERGLDGQKWTAEKGPITAGDLAKISEQRTNNSGALNALPTPFARFFVAKEAFRRVLEEIKNPKRYAGDAYNRIVSDILDVFELLYNQTYHEGRWGDSYKIVIREWNYDENLKDLKKQVPVLGGAVESYFTHDLKASGNRLFFVVFIDGGRDYLIATSSPFTGFVTPPDLDKRVDRRDGKAVFMGKHYQEMPALTRKSGGKYFSDIRLFNERDKDFKNYMFYLVDKLSLGDEMKELRDYIKQVQITDPDISANWKPQIKPVISEEGNELTINGLYVYRDSGLSTVNFFNDVLIRLPFRLSEDYYLPMSYVGNDDNRDYDYMLPIRRDALSLIKGDFQCVCKVTNTKVIVTLKCDGQEYAKEYDKGSEIIGSRGRTVNLKSENISFNLAVFPNILSPNRVENDYFKVMAVVNDATVDRRRFSINDLDLSFFSRNDNDVLEEIETISVDNHNAKFGVRPAVVRSEQNEENDIDASSKFYEVFNSQFDAISIRFTIRGVNCEGIILPKWRQAQRSQDVYTYAVDLGTTNTYMSCYKVGVDNEPEQLNMDEPMVAFLHDFKRSPQKSLVSVIEDANVSQCRKNFRTEFVPALIDGLAYRFPIRTAFCEKKGDSSKPSLFDNSNIAFFYEKSRGLGNQSVLTDIKWEGGHEAELRLFIRELLLIIKADILQKNATLANTRLVWFRPLSFKGAIKELYDKIWQEEAKNILNIAPSQIECVSESEAPYYYFSKKDAFNSVDAVSIVDIGGGSSDFVYFVDGKPQIANSVHFGCDVLWGNGFNGFDNARSNGIFQRFEKTIHLGDHDDELEQLNLSMCNGKSSTKDIINFWLSNDNRCGITKELKNTYKPLFLYHFASIVYFMAKMYKDKGLDCPRSVLFCGNGSRYIDGLLSSDRETVRKLVATIFRSVYGDIKDIQVILPDSRKECTCYGGLYRAQGVAIPAEFNFQGVYGRFYENVGQLRADFPVFSRELLGTLESFNKLFAKLLNDLIADGELDKQGNIADIIECVSSGLQDSLEKNFKTQVVQKFNDSEVYHDSVFFLPIIDNVLKLTKI